MFMLMVFTKLCSGIFSINDHPDYKGIIVYHSFKKYNNKKQRIKSKTFTA